MADLGAIGSGHAFDGEYIWQVNVGGTMGSTSWTLKQDRSSDPSAVRHGPTSLSEVCLQRNDDTFYIGGWNDDIIYKLKAKPGTGRRVIDSWAMPVGIADSPIIQRPTCWL